MPVARQVGPSLASMVTTPIRAARPPIFQHPWRFALVAGVVVLVGNLMLFACSQSDTSREGITYPVGLEVVSPRPGELLRPQDTITADLRNDLTGVLRIDGAEVPEDQTIREPNLGIVSFRTGHDTDIEAFTPGIHTVTVLFWTESKPRPAHPAAYSWSFRVGA